MRHELRKIEGRLISLKREIIISKSLLEGFSIFLRRLNEVLENLLMEANGIHILYDEVLEKIEENEEED